MSDRMPLLLVELRGNDVVGEDELIMAFEFEGYINNDLTNEDLKATKEVYKEIVADYKKWKDFPEIWRTDVKGANIKLVLQKGLGVSLLTYVEGRIRAPTSKKVGLREVPEDLRMHIEERMSEMKPPEIFNLFFRYLVSREIG